MLIDYTQQILKYKSMSSKFLLIDYLIRLFNVNNFIKIETLTVDFNKLAKQI